MVVTAYSGWSVAKDGTSASIRLENSDGAETRISFTPECLSEVAVALLEMKAAAEHRAQAGIPTSDEVGERFSVKAIQVAEVRVDIPDKSNRVVLNFWNNNGAHFPMVVLREFVGQIRRQLERI